MGLLKKLVKTMLLPIEINLAFSKGGLGANSRALDSKIPDSWEFSAFSNNGEDGIVDYLIQKIKHRNHSFVEIGSSNGIANNTAYLALVKRYRGLMIEGSSFSSRVSRGVYRYFNRSVTSLNEFVSLANIDGIVGRFPSTEPDVFSIDIDGMDYHIMKKVFELKVRPSVVVVEYNANYGPERPITLPYMESFDYSVAHPSRLYYGVAITAWRNLFEKYGYQFITVDSSGVNAFFVKKDAFDPTFLQDIQSVNFRDNIFEMTVFNMNWEKRFYQIKELEYIVV